MIILYMLILIASSMLLAFSFIRSIVKMRMLNNISGLLLSDKSNKLLRNEAFYHMLFDLISETKDVNAIEQTPVYRLFIYMIKKTLERNSSTFSRKIFLEPLNKKNNNRKKAFIFKIFKSVHTDFLHINNLYNSILDIMDCSEEDLSFSFKSKLFYFTAQYKYKKMGFHFIVSFLRDYTNELDKFSSINKNIIGNNIVPFSEKIEKDGIKSMIDKKSLQKLFQSDSFKKLNDDEKQQLLEDMLDDEDEVVFDESKVKEWKKLLIEYSNNLNQSETFQVGDFVIWKDGLKNRKIPAYNEPCIIIEVLDPPIIDEEETNSSPYFQEKLDVKIGLIYEEKSLFSFYMDSSRFKKMNK